MSLGGLHLLLTYQCTFECNHCFVWGSPRQTGTMSLAQIRDILDQARQLGSVQSIFFEGGEPFMYYATMLRGIQIAHQMGFKVGIVSNAYWAVDLEDALENLRPLAGLISGITVSSDLFHYNETISREAQNATRAADQIGISVGMITIASPETSSGDAAVGQLPEGESGVMFRGRAAEKLTGQALKHPWESFTNCPFEDLEAPGRVHVDPLGNLHICQGISMGNMFADRLVDIVKGFRPYDHPILGPLLKGGPTQLVREYDLPHMDEYADACHLCYQARLALRPVYPDTLTPDQVYGVF